MHIPWDELQLFLAVAEARSLTAAAKRLRITQPTASRRLAELEATLGERLFVRSVAGVTPTSFGERLLEPARRMAEWAGEVDRAAERAETTPQGSVRITAPPGVAFDLLVPFARIVKRELPGVRLEIISSIAYLDLVRREADLALRFAPSPSDLESLETITFEAGVFAAPTYVRSLPKKPTIAAVDWIAWAPPLDHLSPNPELARLIPGFTPAFASDDFLVQLRAAEEGIGAIFLGRSRHPASRLVLEEIDLELPIRPSSVMSLMCARSALDIPRVRATADLLGREMRRFSSKSGPPSPEKKRAKT